MNATHPTNVVMTCPKCHVGFMQYTKPIMLMSCPPQYPHTCSKCGHEVNYYNIYYPTCDTCKNQNASDHLECLFCDEFDFRWEMTHEIKKE